MNASLKTYCDLALAIAATLECPETPRELVEVLLEAENPLVDLLARPGPAYLTTAVTLRALAAMGVDSGSGHTLAYSESKKCSGGHTDVFLCGSENDSDESLTLDSVPLAKASVSQNGQAS